MSGFQVLGISVSASFLALLLLGVWKILWSALLENYYLKLTCRHLTDISGKWIAEYTDMHGHSCYDETELKQFGHKIEGTTSYRIKYKQRDKEVHKVFKIRGLLRNDLFTAYYWNANRKQKGSGSFVLSISREGNSMEGKYAWFDVEAGALDTGDYEWKRG